MEHCLNGEQHPGGSVKSSSRSSAFGLPEGWQDERARNRIAELRATFGGVLAVPAVPLPGSILWEEHEFTRLAPIGRQVTERRGFAYGVLVELFRHIPERDEHRCSTTTAYYAMIRAALEATAIGLWLVEPEGRRERIHRSLRLAYDDASAGLGVNQMTMRTSEIAEEEARIARIRDELILFKDEIGSLKQRELDTPPKVSSILQTYSSQHGTSGRYEFASPYGVWKLCSGLMHGDLALLALVTRPTTSAAPRLAWLPDHNIPAMLPLAVSVLVCVELFEKLDERIEQLSRQSYGGREIASTNP